MKEHVWGHWCFNGALRHWGRRSQPVIHTELFAVSTHCWFGLRFVDKEKILNMNRLPSTAVTPPQRINVQKKVCFQVIMQSSRQSIRRLFRTKSSLSFQEKATSDMFSWALSCSFIKSTHDSSGQTESFGLVSQRVLRISSAHIKHVEIWTWKCFSSLQCDKHWAENKSCRKTSCVTAVMMFPLMSTRWQQRLTELHSQTEKSNLFSFLSTFLLTFVLFISLCVRNTSRTFTT